MAREFLAFLNGGLNTADDPSILKENQLVESVGMEYRPPSSGLFATPGRSRFDAGGIISGAGGANVWGIIYASFDTSATAVNGDRLVAFSGTSAFGVSGVGDSQTGTFATLKSDLTEGATAFGKGIHFNNNWYFWNGTDASWALFGTSMVASALHGLGAITDTITVSATAEALPNDTGDYEVWITQAKFTETENAQGNDPDIEGSFTGTVASVTVSANQIGVSITYPSWDGTEGLVFRAYAGIAGQKFPIGFLAQQQVASSVDGGVGATHWHPLASRDTLNAPYRIAAPIGGVPVPFAVAPPTIYDAVIFQESMCTIDADKRWLLKYSAPGDPQAFPSVNVLTFPTDKQDNMNTLAVVNDVLLAFSSFWVYRINDLPRHADPENIISAQARVISPLISSHGCTSPRGTALFNVMGVGELLLFVCRDGIHITDGFSVDYASQTLDWENTVSIANLDRAALVNNPKRMRVEFYYPSAADSSKWERLDFYYHVKFLVKDEVGFPALTILGPTDVPGPAATVGVFNSDWRTYMGTEASAYSWFEGTGLVDNALLVDSSGTINKRVGTRKFYFGPEGSVLDASFETQRVYTHQAQTSASGSATLSLIPETDDLGPYTATSTVDFSLKGAQPHEFLNDRAQSVRARIVKDDGGAWQELNYMVFVVGGESLPLASAKSSS